MHLTSLLANHTATICKTLHSLNTIRMTAIQFARINNKVQNTLDGHDKLLKFIQYLCKLIAYNQPKDDKQSHDKTRHSDRHLTSVHRIIARLLPERKGLLNLASSLSLARKTFRLGRWLNEAKSFVQSQWTNPSEQSPSMDSTFWTLVEIGSDVCDDIVTLCRLDYFHPGSAVVARIKKTADDASIRLWLLLILRDLYIKIPRLTEKLRQLFANPIEESAQEGQGVTDKDILQSQQHRVHQRNVNQNNVHQHNVNQNNANQRISLKNSWMPLSDQLVAVIDTMTSKLGLDCIKLSCDFIFCTWELLESQRTGLAAKLIDDSKEDSSSSHWLLDERIPITCGILSSAIGLLKYGLP